MCVIVSSAAPIASIAADTMYGIIFANTDPAYINETETGVHIPIIHYKVRVKMFYGMKREQKETAVFVTLN